LGRLCSHKQSRYFAKELQNYLALLLAWASSLLKQTSMYLRMLLLKKHCNNGKIRSAFFCVVNVFGVSFQLDIICCKQSCVEIEICVLFTYIRRLLHKGRTLDIWGGGGGKIPLDIFFRWPKKFFPESSSKSSSIDGAGMHIFFSIVVKHQF
jgi:hypothetical protein